MFREAEVVNVVVPYQWNSTETIGISVDPESTVSKLKTDPNTSKDTTNQVNGISYKDSILSLTISDFTRIAMYIWIGVGIILAFIRIVICNISLNSLRRWTIPNSKGSYLKLYHQTCKENRIKRYPRLMVNPKLATPSLAGLLRPVLCLPECEYTEDELRLIFKHELHHFKNKDL